MALQPAAGARDLNPLEVDGNRRLRERLAAVYRLWGYQEVAPPSIERLDTLEAGGAIDDREVVRLVSDEPLGLRPEMTASIARAASTRLAGRPRPLRLWANGTTFRSFIGDAGSQRVQEQLQSGVELLGVASAAADAELLRLLLACTEALGLEAHHQPRLLLGHHGVLSALLERVPCAQRTAARQALTGFDPLALEALPLEAADRQALQQLMRLRGEPTAVLYQLEQLLGPVGLVQDLGAVLSCLAPTAERLGVAVQLDPSFQPHFDLYDGLVLKLVCRGDAAPVEIASGGRYDALVGRFGGRPAAGVGFSFQIEEVRELLGADSEPHRSSAPVLVAYGEPALLGAALDQLQQLHGEGQMAELLSEPCPSQVEAEALAAERGASSSLWLAA
ncbi:ATP phosphoribosyltransferase regulatory subunit [Cyanobium sp. Morenito 9A2]|uniref:ATP phosphoribosyltransferase regulatory subunit n=1 Tax=Cyanobium sp. Morenito 9A2 TaxID=2823718 RepID=UPI0020CDECCF|nr:ATP phosphoribosyltransferase regulatory subunit [Cyanobium sp. Morenito 9A2]MCP9850103.1 ATP phosphoribosyltransferase regulatory subunit [Cyanobium sp. Morenito 9A2]